MIQDDRVPFASAELPPGMLAATRVPHRLLRLGVPLGPLRLLETRGRRTGRPRTTPVVVLRAQGERWIVSPFGEAEWVRNVRRSPTARLGRGARLRPITLTAAAPEVAPHLLRTYRRRYRAIPFVRAAFEAGPSDGVDVYAAVAQRHPAFRIERS